MYSKDIFEFGKDDFDVVVTGPRRSMFQTALTPTPSPGERGNLKPYFATPFGDMMIAGCFGLLAATAKIMPNLAEAIHRSLRGEHRHGVAPWDNLS